MQSRTRTRDKSDKRQVGVEQFIPCQQHALVGLTDRNLFPASSSGTPYQTAKGHSPAWTTDVGAQKTKLSYLVLTC